ncbi:MAG TPA: hypothetical protein VEW42_02685 [Candidatus Eisenbacteria bacterium]|nr:hypothetical protein [Candidatus Eisenbacteria bacterium]
MHVIVVHASPDWDAIGSVWILKRFLPGWENAKVEFVPAGQRSPRVAQKEKEADTQIIVESGDTKILHADTGLTPLDHHQIYDTNICSASRCWDYVLKENKDLHATTSDRKREDKIAAMERIVKYLVELDHFQEVFWKDADSDIHEFSIYGILEGQKSLHPDNNEYFVSWGMEILDAMLRRFESKIWAEKEIEKGKQFETKWGKGLGLETINDSVIKQAQKMGYVVVVRRDPRKGYVRIKAVPFKEGVTPDVNLSLVYNQLEKMDPDATWFLHVSNKMLLNGTPKNPKMIPTKLSLEEIIAVLEKI